MEGGNSSYEHVSEDPDMDEFQLASRAFSKLSSTPGQTPSGTAATVARKRAYSDSQPKPWRGEEDPEEMEESDELGQPDLIAYFAQWDIPWKDAVLMCRAYASYLTAAHRTEVKAAATK
nr:MAG: hypothetical protein [Cressdnaviricota sp.]